MSKDKQVQQDKQSKTPVNKPVVNKPVVNKPVVNKPVQEEMRGVETAVTNPIPILQRAAEAPQSISPHEAKTLQRTIGNQALGRLTIQRKMTVGPVGDKYEQEADAVAKQVVSKLNTPSPQTAPAQTAQRQEEEELQMEPLVQRQEEEELQMKSIQRQEEEDELQMKPLPSISSLQRQEEDELQMKPLVQRQEEEELQAKSETTKGDPMLAGGELGGDVETAVAQAKSGGNPLDDTVRQPMEQAFQADFSGVKVHTDSTSDTLNRSLSARAFTTGQDVFFRQGEYNPSSSDGQQLLAHELTHTIQQTGGKGMVQREIIDIPGTSEKLHIPDGTGQVSKTKMAHEAKAIINFIKKEYGIDIDSGIGVESIKKDYVDVPDPVKDNLETSNWNLRELKALKQALSYYAPILGANRKSSTYSGSQGVTTFSKVKQAIDEDSPLGALDNTTLGEKFSTMNISLFDIIRNSTSDFPAVDGDNSKNISGTIVHELSHALIEDKVLSNFVSSFDYWEDEDTHKSKADSVADGYEAPITNYGKTNAAEDLAETMMYYFKDRGILEGGKPGKVTGEWGNPCPERKTFVDGIIAAWTP